MKLILLAGFAAAVMFATLGHAGAIAGFKTLIPIDQIAKPRSGCKSGSDAPRC